MFPLPFSPYSRFAPTRRSRWPPFTASLPLLLVLLALALPHAAHALMDSEQNYEEPAAAATTTTTTTTERPAEAAEALADHDERWCARTSAMPYLEGHGR